MGVPFDRPQPQSLDAEKAVLATCLAGSAEAVESARVILPDATQFYNTPHRKIWQAILDVCDEGYTPDIVTVTDQLQRTNESDDIKKWLFHLLGEETVPANIAKYALIVSDNHRRRHILNIAQQVSEAAYDPHSAPDTIILPLIRDWDCENSRGGAKLTPIKATELMEESPEVDWLVDKILPASRALLLTADAGTGKSMAALDLALAVDQGRRWLGNFQCKRGKVLLVDEENGRKLLARRTGKAIKGANVNDGLLRNIHFLCMNGVNLSEREWVAKFEGVLSEIQPDLVIIDTLSAIHSQDENSAEDMKPILNHFKRWMETYGCAFCILHHNRKPSMGGNNRAHSYRGTTAIKAFVDSALDMKQVPGSDGLVSIHHVKSRTDVPVAPFVIEIVDVDEGATVVRLADNQNEDTASKLEEAQELILDMVANGEKVSRQEVIDKGKLAGISRNTMDEARKLLIKTGKLSEIKEGRQAFVVLPERFSQSQSLYREGHCEDNVELSMAPTNDD
jgi:hypothetical protein